MSEASPLPDAIVDCVVRNSRSWEDVLLLPLLLAAAALQGSGTFVELGGFTGEEGSQTWLLEKCFGWSGTLIEASPVNYASMLLAGRTARLVHSGVCRPAGQLTVTTGDKPCSVGGNLDAMTAEFRQTWAHRYTRNVTVPCRPLLDLLDDESSPVPAGAVRKATVASRRGATEFSFLSLDVEGAEEMVLRTLHATPRFPFAVALVEVNREAGGRTPMTNSSRRVLSLLARGGLAQLPMGKVPGSENVLFARPELGDPRKLQVDAPQAAISQIIVAAKAARPHSKYSTVPLAHLGGPVAFAKRAARGLVQASAVQARSECKGSWSFKCVLGSS